MQLIYEESKWSRRLNQLWRGASGIENRLLYSFRDDASTDRETKAAGVKIYQTDGSGGPVIRPTDQRSVTSKCNKILKKRTNQQNAQINFGLINLLFFNHSNMFRPLNRSHHQGVQNPWELQAIAVECCSIPQQSHRDVNTYTQQHSNRLSQWLVTLKDFELPDDGFD